MHLIRTTLFLILCLIGVNIHSQTTIKPFNSKIYFDEGERPCIQVNLDPETKSLKKAWKNYLKDNYDLKLKGFGFFSNKDLLSAEEVTVNQISSKSMDFYTHIVEDENGSEMKIFARLGYDIFVNKESYPNEYDAILEITESFIKYYLPKYYESEINVTEKRVKELTKETENLNEEIAKKTNKIEKLKGEINKKEEELRMIKVELETTEKKLDKRQEKLERIRVQFREL